MADERRVVVLLSGGVDSATLLYHVRDLGYAPLALGVLYGQRHAREVEAARKIAALAGSPFELLDLRAPLAVVFEGAVSSQVGAMIDVPEGHYTDASMRTTIVPNRNMLLLAIAGARAAACGAQAVAYAAHAGDHAIYPDCRPDFFESCGQTLQLACGVELLAPWIHTTKAAIVARGSFLGVPFGETWSCYGGRQFHCGRCGTCVERLEAFRLAAVEDPVEYEVVGA